MRKFWNWSDLGSDKGSERTLYLNGVIAEDSWFGDEATPKMFRNELMSGTGNITVWVNSPGGDVLAAAQIYNMLKEYAGNVTVKIDGLAASAASVVAMAGDEVLMSPVSCLMVHNPSTIAWGDSEEMRKTKDMLDEIKESIINAYETKSGLSRTKLAHMMDDETWISAHKAVELGFADKIMFTTDKAEDTQQGFVYNRMAVTNSLISKLPKAKQKNTGTPIESLDKRLSLVSR